ncbi:MAG: hypothetical protein IJ493_00775 [Clostridia bacterium]|nr:hypothetical protein [Clostridia bacterium]
MKLTLIRPSHAHNAYAIAADTFAALAAQVGGAEVSVITDLDPIPADTPLVVIGSDAVNHFAADLYFSRRIDGFSIRYCTDDYCIRTQEIDGRPVLFLAGGRPRSQIYAVYRYFEKFCGCRWFWDGDRIPSCELPLAGVDLVESPRFEYRGLRYFAHRSLHRFQAEHWSLEDWQHEIDWILKKRLNLFMLRIGLDDIFQKAFPDIVSYPDRDNPLPEAGPGYDDRTLFWSLEYRGELRKKLLAYAFERDLMHPEDCGTMTHWYSRTPIDFLDRMKPELLSGQQGGPYREKTGMVWDIRKDENLDNYFKLTDTHVKEYGKPELFHTIGLAERSYSSDREENMRLKLNVYRRIASHLKEKYPNAPLLIASWDLWMFYTPEEVQRLVAELDPSQSIILDYTSDTTRESNFTNWGVLGKFPWIFGIFSGYEPNSEIRGYYELTNERIQIAKNDPMCKGVILWPELSHGDTLITEYLARNAWDADTLSIADTVDTYCRDRYAADDYDRMAAIWRDFMPIVQMRAWSVDETIWHHGSDTFAVLRERAKFDGKPSPYTGRSPEEAAAHQAEAVRVLNGLAALEVSDEFLRRDVCDIARTVLGRYVDCAIRLCEVLYGKKDSYLSDAMDAAVSLMKALRDLLAAHEDYSLLDSLNRLRAVTDTNPNFEITLKRNAENNYCRSYIYENAAYLYLPEMEILFDEVKKAAASGADIHRGAVNSRMEANRERFWSTPLAVMNQADKPALRQVLSDAAEIIEKIKFI